MNNCKVGIDRILCKGLNVNQVNIELLKSRGFTVMQNNDRCIRILKDSNGENSYINYIKVSKQQDNTLIINELRMGQLETESNVFTNKVDYEHLDVTLPKSISDTRTNEDNINNSIDLIESIRVVEAELEGLGFGDVDLLNTEIKEIEINLNIDIKRPFKEYEKVLNYMQDLLPKRLKSDINNNYKPKDEYTGFKSGNKSMSIKIYDKRASVLKDCDIGKERLRIEYSLLNEQKIKDIFGSNRLDYIVKDDFNLIDKAFKKLLQADLLDRIYKDIDRQKKHAIKEIGRYKATKTKMSGQEYIYDHEVIDIEVVLGSLKENTLSNHYAKECKKLINRSVEGKQIHLFGNINKINELLEEMGQAKIEIEMTNHIKKMVSDHY